MADVAVVVTTYNALPWIEQCLESVAEVETVVVDNDSTDGTVAFVQSRFPAVRLVEQPNLGLAAGWKRGLEEICRESLGADPQRRRVARRRRARTSRCDRRRSS